jgi:tetratricopeptide (TPR) repeat protein
MVEIALVTLGQLAHIRGQYEQAKRLCGQSLDICQEVGSQWGVSFALYHLGKAHYALGEYAKARERFYRSLQVAVGIATMPLVAYVAIGVAVMLAHTGEHRRAHSLLSALLRYPRSNYETKKEAERLRQELRATLPAAEWDSEATDLDLIVAELLYEFDKSPISGPTGA